MTERSFLFLGTEEDKNFLPYLKPHLKGHKCFVDLKPVTTITEVELYARNPNRNISGVISTSPSLLDRFTGGKGSIDSYSGSYFKRNGLEYVFVNPLEQCVTVSYGSFLLERFTSKLVSREQWLSTPEFNWCVLTPRNAVQELAKFQDAYVIAADIETFKHNLAIRCIGFTAVFNSGTGDFSTRSVVLPLDSSWALETARKFCDLEAPKIFQNGKYDQSYLLRYGIICRNWLWDTATLFHSWYSELPKDLAFLQSFFVREASYWKDLAESNDLETYYLYNAKDTWATACAFLSWMREAPDWARTNYLKEFPLLYPCLLSEMIGLKRDALAKETAAIEVEQKILQRRLQLDKNLGITGFNPNSPKQVGALFKVLGCGDLGSTDDKSMAKAIYRHPLNRRILGIIRGVPKSDDIDKMGIRALRKVQGTYLGVGEDDKDFHGRWLYALNPHATDTSRLASRDHHFWCGQNVQNVPVGKIVKQTVVADEGFFFGECDLEQAETRDTAYITGDAALLAALSSGRDFHSHNVEAFFGLPYDSIIDSKGKVLNKPIRNIGKRVNHGANYNMGPDVLVDTMGEEAIFEAARLLGLPRGWTAREIAEHLLRCFDKTYPTIRGEYQVWVINQVATNKKLVGATGWTRYCFDNPRKSKSALNAYVAHNPQSLNAQVLNMAYMDTFYKVAIHPEHHKNFKLHFQCHDSIGFAYREGHEYLADIVKQCMEIPIQVTDIKGVTRTLLVPAALKLGKKDPNGNLIRARRWSEIE